MFACLLDEEFESMEADIYRHWTGERRHFERALVEVTSHGDDVERWRSLKQVPETSGFAGVMIHI